MVGKAELMKSLLSILDEFELALIVVNKTPDKIVARGVEMLYSNFTDLLKRRGLKRWPARACSTRTGTR